MTTAGDVYQAQRRKRPHRCAVCWQHLLNHDMWQAHCEGEHGALLNEFGFDLCGIDCPGCEHVRMKREGAPVRRVRAVAREWKSPDGTLYTQQELPA